MDKYKLLKDLLSHYTPGLSDVDTGLFSFTISPIANAADLLSERKNLVGSYYLGITQQMAALDVEGQAHLLIHEHKLAMLAAELPWLKHTIAHLRIAMHKHPWHIFSSSRRYFCATESTLT